MGLFDGLDTPKWMSPVDLNMAASKSNEAANHNFLQAFLQSKQHAFEKERWEASNSLPPDRKGGPSIYPDEGDDDGQLTDASGKPVAVTASLGGGRYMHDPSGVANPAWMSPEEDRFKFDSPTKALAGIYNADNLSDAAQILQANSDWLSNPTYRGVAEKAMSNAGAKQKMLETAKAAQARLDQSTVKASIERKLATDFAEAMLPVDAAAKAKIMAIQGDPNSPPTPEQIDILNSARHAMNLPPVGVKAAEVPKAQSPLGKVQADLDAALERGDFDAADELYSQIQTDKTRTPFPSNRERDYAFIKRLEQSTDPRDKDLATGLRNYMQTGQHQGQLGAAAKLMMTAMAKRRVEIGTSLGRLEGATSKDNMQSRTRLQKEAADLDAKMARLEAGTSTAPVTPSTSTNAPVKVGRFTIVPQ